MNILKSQKEDGEGGRIWKVAKERIFIQLFEHFIKLKSYKRLLKYKFLNYFLGAIHMNNN